MEVIPAVRNGQPARNVNRQSLVVRLADRYSVDPEKLLPLLKATAFRQRPNRDGVVREPSNEEMFALLIIADKYELDPFTKELYAYLDPKSGAIIAVVSVDGWIRLINRQPTLRSLAFKYADETTTHKGKTVPVWMECEIMRSDRDKPVTIREYFAEVVREVAFATPWDSHPNRMLRHKTLIQAARVAYGFGGLHDEDEAQRIMESTEAPRVAVVQPPRIAQINAEVTGMPPPSIPTEHAEPVAFGDTTGVDEMHEPIASAAPNTEHGSAIGVSEVAAMINNATTLDGLALATDLIRTLPKMSDQRAMNLHAAERRTQLTQGTADDAAT